MHRTRRSLSRANSRSPATLSSFDVGLLRLNGLSSIRRYRTREPTRRPNIVRLATNFPEAISMAELQWASICETSIFPQRCCDEELSRSIREITSSTAAGWNKLFMQFLSTAGPHRCRRPMAYLDDHESHAHWSGRLRFAVSRRRHQVGLLAVLRGPQQVLELWNFAQLAQHGVGLQIGIGAIVLFNGSTQHVHRRGP